jgi:hypothetical protein
MKPKKILLLFISCLMFISCKKYLAAALAPDDFSGTKYTYLGSWNSNGVPNYLVSPSDTISQGMINFINTTLPEGVNNVTAHPELFTSSASANLNITSKTEVFITFAHDGSGNTNSVGFYTYPTANPPLTASAIANITILFPAAKAPGSNGYLPLGSKVNIGTYTAGTSIGFVILQSGWVPSNASVFTGGTHFASADALNPETDPTLQRHAVLLNYQNKTLICFEDSNRQSGGSDNDFNDVIIYATETPVN